MGEEKPLRCPHDKGSYPAEIVENKGTPVYQHYRCNGCDIIIDTKRL